MAVAATAGLAGILVAHATGGRSRLVSLGGSGPSATSPAGSGAKGGHHSNGGANPSTPGPGAHVSGSATGSVVQYGYGEISVKVTLSAGKIVNLAVARLATAESYSQSIAQQVIPMLRSEVLSAQSARISAISGATYTCEGYAMSVQSALDKLHVK
ncbi:MAG: FMN-binding protein [Actinomycetota bacterium]|nr:FMN-binding protein [Actinomycetota bacterium]